MQVISLEIFNILSIGHIKLQFNEKGLTLVEGWNYDDSTANGSGKSAIFNALAYCLYGKIPRKITATEILRKGTKKGWVKTEVTDGNTTWSVERGRPTKLIFQKNNKTIDITQEEFEKKIRFTYNQFLIALYSAQTAGEKYIDLNDTGKKNYILQLMDLEKISDAKKLVDSEIKELKKGMIEIEGTIREYGAKIEVHKESLSDVKEQRDILEKYRTKLYDLNNKTENAVKRPDLDKFDDLKEKVYEKLSKLRRQEQHIAQLRERYSDLTMEIEEDVSCPSCGEGLTVAGGAIESTEKLNDKNKERADELVQKINAAPNFRAEIEKCQTLLQQIKEKRSAALEAYETAAEQSKERHRLSTIYNNQIRMAQDKIDSNDLIKQKIDKLQTASLKEASKLDDLKEQILYAEAEAQIFSPTGASAYIMDSTIDIFNEEVVEQINSIWPNATYSLQSYKENKTGDVKAKFSERLTINGVERSRGSLSGGEYKCLSLGIDFANISVLEKMFSTFINPIILDEPFEGLDAANRERVISMLEKVAQTRQIIVVDHASEAKSMFTDVIRVEKRNGVTTMV